MTAHKRAAAAHPGPAAHKAAKAIRRAELDDDFPAAGPHAKPHLTDPERTPGTGALPDVRRTRDPDATG